MKCISGVGSLTTSLSIKRSPVKYDLDILLIVPVRKHGQHPSLIGKLVIAGKFGLINA